MGFFAVALLIWVTLHAYVAWRVAFLPTFRTWRQRLSAACAVAALGSTFLAARTLGDVGLSALAQPAETIGVAWMGIAFYVFLCLLAVDVATGFGFFFRRRVAALRGTALLAAGLIAALAAGIARLPPVVRHHEVVMPGLPPGRDGTVLVFISDLHLAPALSPAWTEARVAQVLALRPDLVVVGGDIFEHIGSADDPHVRAMRRLAAPLGVWAVNGNHDRWRRAGGPSDLLAAAGIRPLRDEWQQAAPGLIVAGIDDRAFAPAALRDEAIGRALAGRPAGAATVFVSHAPVGADTAARAGARLMLSGHTHGGQIWPFGYVVRRMFPLLAGRYEVGGMPVLVSRGTGTWGPRMRFWHRGEILRVVLRGAAR